MSIKSLFISILFTGVFATAAFAGGSHGQGHDSQTKSSHHGNKKSDDEHASAVGQPAQGAWTTKTINVTTLDTMRFKFSSALELKDGDIINFVVTNKGKIAHEFSIGDAKEQAAHREMMKKMPNMLHEDGNTVTIQPGETKVLNWEFKGTNEVVFACNVPGHFEAGMFAKAKINTAHSQH